jgi:hypothetical protein
MEFASNPSDGAYRRRLCQRSRCAECRKPRPVDAPSGREVPSSHSSWPGDDRKATLLPLQRDIAGGVFAADHFRLSIPDGVASILIGGILGTTAAILARETKGLLIGERASEKLNRSLILLARHEEGVACQRCPHGSLGTRPDRGQSQSRIRGRTARSPDRGLRAVAGASNTRASPRDHALFIKPQTRRSFDRAIARRRAT